VRDAVLVPLLLVAVLSTAEAQRSMDDPFGRSDSLTMTTITDKVVLEVEASRGGRCW